MTGNLRHGRVKRRSHFRRLGPGLVHQTGANQSRNCHRAALFGYYVVRWLRPQINWNAALWPEVAARTAEVYDAVCAAPPPDRKSVV